jgi:protoporphyrinogen oxidase
MTTAAAARRVAVIGAGPMGLAAAYDLMHAGAQVSVYERDNRIGGMSAFTELDGTRIERYYHFICRPDQTLFDWLRSFALEDRLKWVDTYMGFYFRGRLYDWGGPLALLRFPGLSLLQKLRFACHIMKAKSISDWRPYDAFSSTEWLVRWIGKGAYDVMWKALFHYKFYELEDSLSAAWLGTRIKRVALSRRNIFQERLGYVEGGSEVLLEAIANRLRQGGARIELEAAVQKVLVEPAGAGGRVVGLRVGGTEERFDRVISTIPLPYLSRLVPDLPAEEKAKIDAIRNVGVVCVLLKLRRPFTRNFWMNINDPRIRPTGTGVHR